MIEITGVSFSYGKRPILENLSFELPSTGLTRLSGSNGIGKTTLLRVLGGVLKAPLTLLPENTRIAFWDNECLTFDYLTVEEMLSFMESIHPDSTRSVEAESLILPEMRESRINGLSLGQRARLVWALAEMTPCNLLLLDEPFNGLDAQARDQAVKSLVRLSSSRHVMFSAHEDGPWAKLGARELKLVDAHTLTSVTNKDA